MSAWNELAVTLSSTNPTEVAASLVFVVQSPWVGLFFPNASFADERETDVDVEVDVDVEGVVGLWVFPQADTKAKVAVSRREATVADRPGNEFGMRAILWRYRLRLPGPFVT